MAGNVTLLVAEHCTAVIGAMGTAIAIMGWFSIFKGDKVFRQGWLTAMFATQFINCYIHKTYPMNTPTPTPPFEMPWPVIMLTMALCIVALVVGEAEETKSKKK